MVGGLATGAGLKPPSSCDSVGFSKMACKVDAMVSTLAIDSKSCASLSFCSRYNTEKIEKELGWKLTVSVKEAHANDFARGLR